MLIRLGTSLCAARPRQQFLLVLFSSPLAVQSPAMARARSYSHLTKMLFIVAVSGLDAPRSLARRGVLAQSLLFVPGVANAGIADQLEAASRASEITYSQNGKKQCGNQPVRLAGLEVLFIILAASMQHESAWRPRTRRLRLIHPNV